MRIIRTITSILPPVHGGRTHALLRRVKFLEEELGIKEQQIITTNYNANYNDVYEDFLKDGKITKNIQIINIYDYICEGKLFKQNGLKVRETKLDIPRYTSEAVPKRNAIRYYSKGDYVLFRKFYDNTHVLHFEDIMSNACKHKIQRKEYNKFGILHKKTHYSVEENLKLHEEYYDVTGHKYMEKFYSEAFPNKVIGIQIYDSKNHVLHSFTNENELFKWFFYEIFDDGDVIFNDARLLDYSLLENTKFTRNFIVIHADHNDLRGNLKNSFKYAFNHSEKVSQFIVLTNKQKKDIINELNIDSDKITVIPHSSEQVKIKRNNIKNNFVYIGRVHPLKQLSHLIYAFNIFSEKNTKINLYLYGTGDVNDLKTLKALVHELDLGDRVFFKEYTDEPVKVFNESRASFLTSQSEGFGLTILESLSAGCPVVSYDTKYGPSDLIEDGNNGILVEQNNIDALADAMFKILNEKFNHVENLSEFSIETAKENYRTLLNM